MAASTAFAQTREKLVKSFLLLRPIKKLAHFKVNFFVCKVCLIFVINEC
jgi:hypothetical protein